MEDPALRLDRRPLIDGEGAAARDLLHEVHPLVTALELRRELVAERGLPHPMRPDERDLE